MDIPERPGSGQLWRSLSDTRRMYRRNSTMSKYAAFYRSMGESTDGYDSASFVSEVEMAQDEVFVF